MVQFPVRDPRFGTVETPEIARPSRFPIDEQLLQDIADTAHGKYYHAYGTEALTSVYAEIDKLEKTKVEETRYTEYNEYFSLLLIPGLALLVGTFTLSSTRFRTMP